jgi:hypothetical protein
MPELVEVIYLPEVECELANDQGMLNTIIVGVPDENDNKQYLRVGKDLVARERGKSYLQIGIVELDRLHRRALVELPYEADSGTRRLWVPFDNFRQKGSA